MRPTAELLAALSSWMRDDGSEPGFFDLWLTRSVQC
jgi:hypothetical protein